MVTKQTVEKILFFFVKIAKYKIAKNRPILMRLTVSNIGKTLRFSKHPDVLNLCNSLWSKMAEGRNWGFLFADCFSRLKIKTNGL